MSHGIVQRSHILQSESSSLLNIFKAKEGAAQSDTVLHVPKGSSGGKSIASKIFYRYSTKYYRFTSWKPDLEKPDPTQQRKQTSPRSF